MKFFASVYNNEGKENVQFILNALSFKHANKKAYLFCEKHLHMENGTIIELTIKPNQFTLAGIEKNIVKVGTKISGQFLYRKAKKSGGGFKKEKAFIIE